MNGKKALKLIGFVSFFGLFQTACVRDLLHKYQQGQDPVVQQSGAVKKNSLVTRSHASQPSIYAVDSQSFRFRLPSEQVWDGALSVLLRNYNLNIVDQSSGVITTEWDSFFLDDQIYRNKVSMRIKKLSGDLTEVIVYNNVEALKNTRAGGIVSTWLPSEQGSQEVVRIIQNMAIALRQPSPSLPKEMIAGSSDAKSNVE